jgi:hypothetical protein
MEVDPPEARLRGSVSVDIWLLLSIGCRNLPIKLPTNFDCRTNGLLLHHQSALGSTSDRYFDVTVSSSRRFAVCPSSSSLDATGWSLAEADGNDPVGATPP